MLSDTRRKYLAIESTYPIPIPIQYIHIDACIDACLQERYNYNLCDSKLLHSISDIVLEVQSTKSCARRDDILRTDL